MEDDDDRPRDPSQLTFGQRHGLTVFMLALAAMLGLVITVQLVR